MSRRSARIPKGWFGGQSPATLLRPRVPDRPGTHDITVALDDTGDGAFAHVWQGRQKFTADRNRLIRFETKSSFRVG